MISKVQLKQILRTSTFEVQRLNPNRLQYDIATQQGMNRTNRN